MNYEDEFLPERGPFKIPANTAKETLDRLNPILTVNLDFGAFRRIWEIVESEAHRHYPVRAALSSARAEARAVTEFRKAWEREFPPEEPAQPPARRFKKSAEQPSEPPRRKLKRR